MTIFQLSFTELKFKGNNATNKAVTLLCRPLLIKRSERINAIETNLVIFKSGIFCRLAVTFNKTLFL